MIEASDNIESALQRFLALGPRVAAGTQRALTLAGAFHQREAARTLFGPYTGSGYADKLQTRTGGLRRSVGFETRPGELRLFAGPPARIQEYGGTIRAKRSKYLTIPLRAALTASGVPKRPTARDWDDAFILKSRKGKLFIARRKGSALELLYKLQESVKLPARFGFRELFQKRTVPFLMAQMKKVLAG